MLIIVPNKARVGAEEPSWDASLPSAEGYPEIPPDDLDVQVPFTCMSGAKSERPLAEATSQKLTWSNKRFSTHLYLGRILRSRTLPIEVSYYQHQAVPTHWRQAHANAIVDLHSTP